MCYYEDQHSYQKGTGDKKEFFVLIQGQFFKAISNYQQHLLNIQFFFLLQVKCGGNKKIVKNRCRMLQGKINFLTSKHNADSKIKVSVQFTPIWTQCQFIVHCANTSYINVPNLILKIIIKKNHCISFTDGKACAQSSTLRRGRNKNNPILLGSKIMTSY